MSEHEEIFTPNQDPNTMINQLLDSEKNEITQALTKALDLSQNSFYLTLIRDTLSQVLHNSPESIRSKLKPHVGELVKKYEILITNRLKRESKKMQKKYKVEGPAASQTPNLHTNPEGAVGRTWDRNFGDENHNAGN